MDLAANEKAVHADFFNGKGRRASGLGAGGSPGERRGSARQQRQKPEIIKTSLGSL